MKHTEAGNKKVEETPKKVERKGTCTGTCAVIRKMEMKTEIILCIRRLQ